MWLAITENVLVHASGPGPVAWQLSTGLLQGLDAIYVLILMHGGPIAVIIKTKLNTCNMYVWLSFYML